MNDIVEAVQSPVAPSGTAAAADPPGFGRRLATERERRGLSIDDIAARLRFNPKQVQAIESEALPALPAPFLRGFVRNYARELKLDPGPLLEDLTRRLGPEPLERTEEMASGVSPARIGERVSGRVVLVGVVVGLLVLLLIGWVASRGDASRPETVSQAATSRVPTASPAPAEIAKASGGEPSGQAVAAPAAEVAAAAPAAVPAAAPAVPPAAAQPSTQAQKDGLLMVFRGRSWVEVTQGDGRIILSQINEAGTEQRVEGKPPLRAVIGNASAVVVEYKGTAVDLKPVTSVDNVARITLN